MEKGKVLITDEVHPLLIESLESFGYKCEINTVLPSRSLPDVIEDYTGMVINSRIKVDRTLIDKATSLLFIARMGSGMENIDVSYANKKSIHCINSPEGNRDAVAEHALGMLLTMLSNILTGDQMVRSNLWEREENRGTELNGKSLGIIGFGNTGAAFARLLSGFNVNVFAYDKYVSGFESDYIKESSIEEIFENCNVCSLHVPLTEETTYMVDETFIGKFKQPFYLINTSRGKVVNTLDLIKQLKKGKILGAALDVLENEKISKLNDQEKSWFDELVSNKKVVLTPHVAGWTRESKRRIAQVLVDKITAISGPFIDKTDQLVEEN